MEVAVVYTPAARDAAGGTAAMEAEIDLRIAETNRAYEASGVRHRVALAARSEVSYAETGSGFIDLDRLENPSDGHMDEVHALRERVEADLVHLIVGESDVGGIALLGGDFGLSVQAERQPGLRARAGTQHGAPARPLPGAPLPGRRGAASGVRLREPARFRAGGGGVELLGHDHGLPHPV